MMRPTNDEPIVRDVWIKARPETIFAFFTDETKLVRWIGFQATTDPQPGGIFRLQIDREWVARGEYIEVTPFSRVVFTWGYEGDDAPLSPGASTVEVTLTPDGEGTRVRLTHRDLPPAERKPHLEGWERYLPRLEETATADE